MREDFAALRFHTAIARIIELTAHASRLPRVPRALAEPLVLMVAPLAPHVGEELCSGSATRRRWPVSRSRSPLSAPATVSVTLPVQVNGKVRFTIEVPARPAATTSPKCWPLTPPTRAMTWPGWS